jgi:hypothetical protein
MKMRWGKNASLYRLYENGQLVDTQTLVENTPNVQSGLTSLTNRLPGTYHYRAELVNANGATVSAIMDVTVK